MSLFRKVLGYLYRHIAPYLLPNRLCSILERKRHFSFIEGFKEYKKDEKLSEDFSESNNLDPKIVLSVQGFGFSGSGAVLDLLSEVDVCDVVGTDINNTSKEEDHHSLFESNFLKVSKDLFEIEKYVDSNNFFQNDAAIKRLILYLEQFPPFLENRDIRILFYSFFDEIVDLQLLNLSKFSYNRHLYYSNYLADKAIFFIRPMSVQDYRCKVRRLLSSLFKMININNKSILVFDQLLCDFEFDITRYKEYIPSNKIISVYRDPRDVYYFACKRNVEWIEHSSAYAFIKWYNKMVCSLDLYSHDYLVVQFERLVNNYNEETQRIFNYLGISNTHHDVNLKMRFFNPSVSSRNVGIWRNDFSLFHDMLKIESELKKFCYNRD